MTIKVNSDSCDAEFVINDEATVHARVDIVFYALLLDGFSRNTIINGFKEKIRELEEIKNGKEKWTRINLMN